jgi:amidohydrolase
MPVSRPLLDSAVDELADELIAFATRLHESPEIRFEEHRASAWLAEMIERHASVEVERGVGELPTALRAQVGMGQAPRVLLLAEYDALPEIGHACGHNLIAGASLGAFLALARQRSEIGGSLELLGTPAEEGGGGKIRLLEAGTFAGADAALMFHPLDRNILVHPSLASLWVDMVFSGTPSHAAMAPFDGQSALTACLDTFRLIDSQRVHFRDGVRVHGYITDGGQAVNIIPERAACQFSVRAPTHAELERVSAIVTRCAEGAAMASGVTVAIDVRPGYREMKTSRSLAHCFGAALSALGRAFSEQDDTIGAPSTDMGDVSQVVPAIHPYLAICEQGEALCHQHRFAECARSARGFATMLLAAKALARTAADVLENEALLARARHELGPPGAE